MAKDTDLHPLSFRPEAAPTRGNTGKYREYRWFEEGETVRFRSADGQIHCGTVRGFNPPTFLVEGDCVHYNVDAHTIEPFALTKPAVGSWATWVSKDDELHIGQVIATDVSGAHPEAVCLFSRGRHHLVKFYELTPSLPAAQEAMMECRA